MKKKIKPEVHYVYEKAPLSMLGISSILNNMYYPEDKHVTNYGIIKESSEIGNEKTTKQVSYDERNIHHLNARVNYEVSRFKDLKAEVDKINEEIKELRTNPKPKKGRNK